MNAPAAQTPTRSRTAVGRRVSIGWRARLLAVAGAILLLYVIVMIALYAIQDAIIFPGAYLPPPAAAGPADPAVQQIWLTAPDGTRLEAWFQPGAGRSAGSPGPAVIFFHGNGDIVDERWPVAGPYLARGISFLAIEFRGYGRCAGRPSETALIDDALRWYDWLAQRPEVDPQRIVLHGISLGGGVAVATAERRQPAALIVESTFASIRALSGRFLAPPWLIRHPFRSEQRLRLYDGPVLIIHGRNDRLIPIEHARRLKAAARDAVLIETDAGHDNYRPRWPAFFEFLDRHGL